MPTEFLLIPWLVIIVGTTFIVWRYTWGLPLIEVSISTPTVAVIVPIKGTSQTTEAFLHALRHQDYPAYRIIAAVESEDDPAFGALLRQAGTPGAPLEICVAGLAQRSGQKVHNLLAALALLRPEDEIVAFTDADTLPQPLWLPRLIAGIVNAGRPAVTGYRWMIPADDRLSSAALAAANASIATLLRVPYVANACWGGTMVMRRTTLERIDIRRYWDGALSDDLQMTRALRDHKVMIFSPRQSLLPAPIAMDWRQAFAFGRRQYQLILTHDPDLWLLAALGTAIPAFSFVLAIVLLLQGSVFALCVLALAGVLGAVRTQLRRRIVTALWGRELTSGLAGFWTIDRWLRPLWWAFHTVCVFSAPGSRRISWAGVDYIVRSPQDIEVIRWPESFSEQPAFSPSVMNAAPSFNQKPERP
ncbi:MAG: glycosyltransferase family 2 protein [Methylobacteriaceae bacterium]|nr:glycosyltransferase family 2 protein [Methylobacteriaceae bacterium]